MGIRLIAAMAVALLAWAPSAAARTVFDAGRDAYFDDWRVVDGGLVRTDTNFNGPFDVTFHPRRGRPRILPQFSRVARLAAPRDEDAVGRERWSSFDAAGRRVVLGVSTYNVYAGEGAGPDIDVPRVSELWTATLGGDPVRLHRCKRGSVGDVSTDGESVAWVGTRCERDHTTIAVRDMTGRRPPLTLTAPPERAFRTVLVARDHLLAQIYEPTDFPGSQVAPEEVIVYSRASGSELYRVLAPYDHGLQPDGKLVTLRENRGVCGDEVAWHSPAEPQAHVLTPDACESEVLIADDRILWARRTHEAGATIALTDLAGGAVQPLFPPHREQPDLSAPYDPFFYDGERVAYFAYACARDTIVVDSVAELLEGGPPALPACRASFRALPRSVRVDRGGTLTVTVGCPNGCRLGDLRLRERASGRALAFRHQGVKRDFLDLPSMPVGGSVRMRLRLTPASRDRVRRAGRLAAELAVTLPQPDGRRRTFAKRLTLVAR